MAIGKIYQPPEMELNFNTDWEMMPAEVKLAFRGKPKRVRLESGFMLYKFTEYGLSWRQGDIIKISEWWSPVNSYDNNKDPGLQARLSLAKHLGVSPAALTRVVAAVRIDWNSLTYLQTSKLLKPVWGLWGQCAMQPRRTPPKGIKNEDVLHFPGFSWQFYIPKLTLSHIIEIKRESILK
jgi:hypothetical protein